MRRTRPFLWLTLALLCVLAHPAAAARLAFVIGNDEYANVAKLKKAGNDARKIADTLDGIGFSVSHFANLTQAEMSTRLVEFTSKIQPGDVVLFFFAGHGFEVAERNYLLPVDVPKAVQGQEDLIRDRSFAADAVIERIRARGAKTTIAVLDACRDNPFKQEGGRSLGSRGGLANMSAAEGVFIMFSAGAKQEALDALSDKDSDPNSVFTRFFAKHIAEPGATMLSIAKRTQTDVRRLALSVGRQQMPSFYDQIEGDLILLPKDSTPAAAPNPQDREQVRRQSPQQQQPQQKALAAREPAARQEPSGRPQAPSDRDDDASDVDTGADDFGPAVAVPLRAGGRQSGAGAAQRASTNACDRLAASPFDPDRAPDVSGVLASRIDVRAAAPACEQAMRGHPGVARFVYQAGRIAGARKDFASARELFERALAAKHFSAATALGFLHQTGSGVPRDFAQTRRFYEVAVAQRDPWAMILLGRLHESRAFGEPNITAARRLYEGAAELGEATGLLQLGLLQERGRGVPANPRAAMKLYEQAAQKGSPAAMVRIARMFDNGIGVARDLSIARRWLEKAAAVNHAPAMHALGTIASRNGPDANPALARNWFEKAAALNYARAMNSLALMHLRGEGVPPNTAEAKRLFEAAASLGNAPAMNNLAIMHRDGVGVPPNLGEARRMFQLAAERNNIPAMRNLALLFERGGNGVPPDFREAERWYERAALAEQRRDSRPRR